jgi:sugar O-acyltransferase (sialic acid O-acetyltransferase NeuD family)
LSNVILVGYSGHAFVVADSLLRNNFQIAGYFEKNKKERNPFSIHYLGSEENSSLVELHALPENFYALGLGDNALRKKVDFSLSKYRWSALSMKHPNAIVSRNVFLSEGSFVAAGAVINPLVKIGRACIINTSSVIEHECLLSDYVHIAPGAVLAGNVKVGDSSFIGANATIKQGLTIGSNVVVGAGSVVLNDIPDNEVWVGNPAKRIKVA